MRYQNQHRYIPIAIAKPLPTLPHRGTAATATEIAKETANDENEPPPVHISGGCWPRPPPMPGERRRKTYHRVRSQQMVFFGHAGSVSGDDSARDTRPRPPWPPPWIGAPPLEHDGTTCRLIGICRQINNTGQREGAIGPFLLLDTRFQGGTALGGDRQPCRQPHPATANV